MNILRAYGVPEKMVQMMETRYLRQSRQCLSPGLEAVLQITWAWTASMEQDLKVRGALDWNALHGMRRVWKSDMGEDLKRQLFI